MRETKYSLWLTLPVLAVISGCMWAVIIWLLLTLVGCDCRAQDFGVPCDEVREPIYTYAVGLNVAQAERRPLLIFVTQKQCPPCRVAKRIFEAMRQDDQLCNCVLAELDASTSEARALMVGKRLAPQLILLDTRSEEKAVLRHAIEVIDKPRILALLDRLSFPIKLR